MYLIWSENWGFSIRLIWQMKVRNIWPTLGICCKRPNVHNFARMLKKIKYIHKVQIIGSNRHNLGKHWISVDNLAPEKKVSLPALRFGGIATIRDTVNGFKIRVVQRSGSWVISGRTLPQVKTFGVNETFSEHRAIQFTSMNVIKISNFAR